MMQWSLRVSSRGARKQRPCQSHGRCWFPQILEFQCCSRKGGGIGTGGGGGFCANFFCTPPPPPPGVPHEKKAVRRYQEFFFLPPVPWDRKRHLLGLSGPPPPFRYILLPSIRFRGLCQMQQVKDNSAIEMVKIDSLQQAAYKNDDFTARSAPPLRPGLGVYLWMHPVNGTGNSPVSGTADHRSSQTGQVIRGLR